MAHHHRFEIISDDVPLQARASLAVAVLEIRQTLELLGEHLRAQSSDALTLRARMRRSKQLQNDFATLVMQCDGLVAMFGAEPPGWAEVPPEVVEAFANILRRLPKARPVKSALRHYTGGRPDAS